ncbi:serine hydrolase-like protein [Chanos chanos]|uniref:Serine hydrolase-like protein n=1 Tax=Chanos chanos TaxID=29144 RepID=A0A6J2VRV8_CHACN|nr:serine hydrolase-like protein 2 [Chanos chanos]
MIQSLKHVRHMATGTIKQAVSEFRMPVPWGEMRGRVWGPEQGRPVLCLHGWADNCGTFNTLIPLLPQDWRFVALDLTGHGFSSHRPEGVFYSFYSYVADIRRVIEALQWKRFSLIGHSMGGNVAGRISALYPEMVEALVLLDSYGFYPTDMKEMNGCMRKGIDEMIQYEKEEKKERVYTYEKAKQRLMGANPYLSEQSAQILMERGVVEAEGGVMFTRDFRINLTNIARTSLEETLYLQSKIQAPVLLVLADNGLDKIFAVPDGYADALRKGYQRGTVVTVQGDHHVHLNNPEVVAPIITDFLQKHTSENTYVASDTSSAKL